MCKALIDCLKSKNNYGVTSEKGIAVYYFSKVILPDFTKVFCTAVINLHQISVL